jgi:hypothetical protein
MPKITELPGGPDVTNDDLLPLVDSAGGTPTTKKVTVGQIIDKVKTEIAPGGNEGDIQIKSGSTFGGIPKVPVSKGGTDKSTADLAGQAGKALVVNASETGYSFATMTGGGGSPPGGDEGDIQIKSGSSFAGIAKVPVSKGGTDKSTADLSGQAGKALVVDSSETGYSFATIGGSVPTGTGFRYVNNGVEDTSAKLVVNADVAPGAAIAVTKLAPGAANTVLTSNGTTNSFAQITNSHVASGAAIASSKLAPPGSDGQVVYNSSGSFAAASSFTHDGSGYVTVSTAMGIGSGTLSSTGMVRLPYTPSLTTIIGQRNSVNSGDYSVVEASGTTWTIGIDGGQIGLRSGNVVLNASTAGYMMFASDTVVRWNNQAVYFSRPVQGDTGKQFRLATIEVTIAGNTTLNATQSTYGHIVLTGTPPHGSNVEMSFVFEGALVVITNKCTNPINFYGQQVPSNTSRAFIGHSNSFRKLCPEVT